MKKKERERERNEKGGNTRLAKANPCSSFFVKEIKNS